VARLVDTGAAAALAETFAFPDVADAAECRAPLSMP
jgi:hypothetical protein